ncbi:MAG TPA: hypothetical protein VGE11_01975 [Pseudonocardia sp.]
MPSIPDPAYDHRPDGPGTLRRRVRLVRRHIGPGPYLVFGSGLVGAGAVGSGDVGPGALLALLAAHGSASGFVTDGALADRTRRAAPGCPVHTIPDAIPSGVFRGVLAAARPDDATLALWRRVLVRDTGRVLLVGEGDIAPERLAAAGLRLRWAGREYWRIGAPVVVLQSLPQRPPGA